MPESDDTKDLRLLTDAAHAAGEIALKYWRQKPEAWDKADGAGPVSEADLAVNDMLEAELRTARPDYGWLSEESPDDSERLEAESVFVIDPIDGTRAFLNDEGSFAHALAIVRKGEVVAGVVHLPVRGLTYAATRTGLATLNGVPLTSGINANAQGATVLTSKLSDEPSNWRKGAPPYQRVFRPSLAWRLCLVAEGRFDATLSLRPAWEWDIAAASLIAECAGILSTDRLGGVLRFNNAVPQSNGLLVANPALHAALLAELRPWPL